MLQHHPSDGMEPATCSLHIYLFSIIEATSADSKSTSILKQAIMHTKNIVHTIFAKRLQNVIRSQKEIINGVKNTATCYLCSKCQ